MSSLPTPTVPLPSDQQMRAMLRAAVLDLETEFETTDGCMAEPDGSCPHGHPSWLRRAGLI